LEDFKLILQSVSEKEDPAVSDKCEYGTNDTLEAKQKRCKALVLFIRVFWKIANCFLKLEKKNKERN